MPSNLSKTESETLKWYGTDDGYDHVQTYLATGDLKSYKFDKTELNGKITAMDSTFSKASLPENALVYRGMRENVAKNFLSATNGDIIEAKTFLSTSTEKNVALDFAARSESGKRYVMELKVPKGAKAVSMKNHATFKEEKEILIGRGQKLKALGTREVGNVVFIQMELVK